jgi:hypothetical protein
LETQVMETSKTVSGPEHTDALGSMANLAESGTVDRGGEVGGASDGDIQESA